MIKWGMIGCGAVTERKSAPAYTIAKKSVLHGVTSRTLSSARNYAGRHNIQLVFENPSALINSNDVDAVYIATPPASHLELALLVAKARKPCCIEKPISINHREAVKITQAFKETDTPLFVAYYRRSLPRFKAIKAWINDGKIGTVRHVHWGLTRPPKESDLDYQFSWRTNPSEAPGGYFDDLACHGLDLFDFYFGQVSEIGGKTKNQQKLYGVADSFTASWVHANGITGSGYWNFSSFDRTDEVIIVGDKGKILFSIFDDNKPQCITANSLEELNITHPLHLHKFHVENIIDHLNETSVHPSTGKSATRTAWACDQILGID